MAQLLEIKSLRRDADYKLTSDFTHEKAQQVIRQTRLSLVPKKTVALPRVTFGKTTSQEDLIRQQGILTIKPDQSLSADVWPEDEAIDELMSFGASMRNSAMKIRWCCE
jgi:hypothetical protein